jgi:hypothetical protein
MYIWLYCGLTMRMAVIALQTRSTAHDAHRDAPVIGSRPAIADRVAPVGLPTIQRSR